MRGMESVSILTLLAANLRSAPGNTIAGDLPPSSINDGLIIQHTFRTDGQRSTHSNALEVFAT
jgi:hypothetical protein